MDGEVKAAFRASLEPRRDNWTLLMLRGAQVLKGAENGDWRSFVTTAMALLDGRPVKTIPIMEFIHSGTHKALLNEELGGALQVTMVRGESDS